MIRSIRSGFIATAAVLALGAGAANAQELAIGDLFRMEMMDANKDGSVSRAEYLAQAGKAFDMMAKKAGVTGDRMTREQFRMFMAELQKVSPN